jgi:predicted aspartyl protease
MMTHVTFRLVGGAQPLSVVSVQLNGAGPFAFALDTGAGQPVLTPELAQRLGLHIGETRAAAGAGGRMSVGLTRIASFVVGAASRCDVPVIVSAEIHRISATVGSNLDGVVGYEFLRHYRLTLDSRRRILTLDDGPAAIRGARPLPKIQLPLRLAHPAKPLILVSATVDGTGPYPFALDTGASICVIARRLAERLGVRTEAMPDLTGGGGSITSSAGSVKSIAIETASVINLPVAVADFLDPLSQALGTEVTGIIGYNYLREFLVTIDYPAGFLQLE